MKKIIKQPTTEDITEFINLKYPQVEFDRIKFKKSSSKDGIRFRVINNNKKIAECDEKLNKKFWEIIEVELHWQFV